MKYDIEAIAFDIDGTLYPSWKFYVRITPFIFKHFKLMSAFKKTRKEIRIWQAQNPTKIREDFFDFQNEIFAKFAQENCEVVKQFLNEEIYIGWRKKFSKIKPFPFAKQTITQLKQAGLKIGILSDFVPEQKGDIWGILPLCDVALGAEQIGALKPSKLPFQIMASKLGVSPQKIMYVGNNFKYDIIGAKQAGMLTAYIQFPISAFFSKLFCKKTTEKADINFSNYKQLLNSLL